MDSERSAAQGQSQQAVGWKRELVACPCALSSPQDEEAQTEGSRTTFQNTRDAETEDTDLTLALGSKEKLILSIWLPGSASSISNSSCLPWLRGRRGPGTLGKMSFKGNKGGGVYLGALGSEFWFQKKKKKSQVGLRY